MNARLQMVILVAFLVIPTIAVASGGRFAVAGLKDTDVHAFFEQLKAAVISHDVEKIASMASYPFVLNGKASVPNRAAFISHYRQIFTPEVIEAVEQQSYDKLWSNWQGVMIGDGEVWFAGICPDSSCSSYEIKIISVNN
ncbi:MAG: hypothetical protein ACRD6B_14375 [Bryobacteraceae bacterium]